MFASSGHDRSSKSGQGNEVTFWARDGKTRGGDNQRVPITLPTIEFMRRWCLHILPKGYTKTRCFGGWHNRRRDAYLERCAIMLEAIDAPLPEDALEFNVMPDPSSVEQDEVPHEDCPVCGCELRLIEVRDKPSWYDVMNAERTTTSWVGERGRVYFFFRVRLGRGLGGSSWIK